MTVVKNRRRTAEPTSPTNNNSDATKKFNQGLRYIQGFRQTVPAGGDATITINLLSPGKLLLGLSVIPSTPATVVNDCQGTLTVNSNNVLASTSLGNLNPNFVGNMLFFPTPQPLQGNDTIKFPVHNNSGTDVTFILNVFYVPR